jgi:hypothetical protein
MFLRERASAPAILTNLLGPPGERGAERQVGAMKMSRRSALANRGLRRAPQWLVLAALACGCRARSAEGTAHEECTFCCRGLRERRAAARTAGRSVADPCAKAADVSRAVLQEYTALTTRWSRRTSGTCSAYAIARDAP